MVLKPRILNKRWQYQIYVCVIRYLLACITLLARLQHITVELQVVEALACITLLARLHHITVELQVLEALKLQSLHCSGYAKQALMAVSPATVPRRDTFTTPAIS